MTLAELLTLAEQIGNSASPLVDMARDWAFYSGSILADELSTVLFVRREGIDKEEKERTKEGMEEYGVVPYLIYNGLHKMVNAVPWTGVLYLFDYAMCDGDMSRHPLPFHHLFCYGIGLTNILTAASNVAGTYGFPKSFLKVLQWPGKIVDGVLSTIVDIIKDTQKIKEHDYYGTWRDSS
ncbi:hypothetical protein KY336_01240 [Candidatus Woesearchaeota archaeon]|nr:hypothetical protein [Candidatus Woesearchaeota archaeon]